MHAGISEVLWVNTKEHTKSQNKVHIPPPDRERISFKHACTPPILSTYLRTCELFDYVESVHRNKSA